MTDKQQPIISPFCTIEWANLFYTNYRFDDYWSSASLEKKLSALCTATDFIDQYCQFYADGMPCYFEHSDSFADANDPNDYANTVNPKRLKQACAQEAAYLLSLDDNPAEPHPLTILGLLKGDFGTVDKSLVPPVFPQHVIKLLSSLGGEVDIEAIEGKSVGFFKRETT